MLTVGGDGTFIQASRRLFGRDLPMLGINMGTLGYLTEVEVQNVEEAVKQLVEGNAFFDFHGDLPICILHIIRDNVKLFHVFLFLLLSRT